MTATRLRLLTAVLAVVATACSSIPFVGGDDGSYEISAEFRRAVNLFGGERVRVAGVAVGTVTSIDVPPGSDVVVVEMSIRGDIDLPSDPRAVIVPQALIGERYVQIDPPYTGGPKLEPGTRITDERTSVPAEFDEVLDSMNDYLRQLPEEEVARLVTNLATVLEGQGETLGATLENTEAAVDALRASDEELVALAGQLADLNETLATRDEQLGAFVEDWNTVAATLARNRDDIDAALNGVARMSEELAGLLAEHRPSLEEDIAILTRIGRTAVRNLGEIERFLFWSKELYRHSDRVIDLEHNWLPQLNQTDEIDKVIADRLADRLEGVCLRLGIEECQVDGFWSSRVPERVCAPPLTACPEDGDDDVVPLPEALGDALEEVPELGRRLEAEGATREDAPLDDVTGGLSGEESGGRIGPSLPMGVLR